MKKLDSDFPFSNSILFPKQTRSNVYSEVMFYVWVSTVTGITSCLMQKVLKSQFGSYVSCDLKFYMKIILVVL